MSIVRPPAPLSPEALRMWERHASALRKSGRLTDDDLESFWLLCDAWGNILAAAGALDKDGMTAPGTGNDRKTVKKHPAFQEWRDSVATYLSLADRFGLNPKSRGAASQPQAETKADVNSVLDP